jgi:putative FmdB family regulatory protein
MPIYAYKCDACGFAKDVLQKMSDSPLTDCPSCGAAAFKKQVTAAGFQLKGSGWYATDFKGGPSTSATSVAPSADTSTPASSDAKPSESAAPKADAPAASTGT